MSNNIYDIMNKLNEVANKDMPVAKKESTDKTLLESTMKEVLNEKYMGFDKTVAAIKKGGSAKNPEAVAASIGRKKYGKEKFQKAAAQGKKMGEGLARIDDPAYKDYYGDDLRPDTATIDEDDMEEGNLFTGNLAKARAAGKKRADLDGDGDMETVREGAKPDYIDLDKDGNRKESMKKAAADKKKQGVTEGLEETEETAVINMFEKLVKQGRDPIDMIAHKFGWGSYELDQLAKNLGFKNSAGWTNAVKQGKGVNEGVTEGKTQHVYLNPLGKHGKSPKKVATIKGKVTKQVLDKLAAKHNTDASNFEWGDDKWNSQFTKQGVAEGTKETSTGRVHKAEPGGYGRKDDDEDGDKKKAEPAVKRGRGRPKKNPDSDTGEVKKYDTDTLQRWIVGSVPKNLPGKASVKHKIKDESDEKLDEKAPPGAKAERMVKHIKKGYAKDGNLTDKEKGIAYATAWKAKKAGKVEESIPPGFPRSLAKKIYEHFDGNVDSTLNAMWRVHNTIMEQNRSNVSEPPEFSMGAGVKPSRVRVTQPEPEFDYGATGKAPKGPSIPPYRPTIDNAEMRQFNRRFKDVMSMPNYVGGHPEGEMGATGNPQNKVFLKQPLAIDTVPAMNVLPDRVKPSKNNPSGITYNVPAGADTKTNSPETILRNIPVPGNFSGAGGGDKWEENIPPESNTLRNWGKKTNEGRVQGGIWRDLPPKAGEKDVPAPYPDEGPTAPIKTAPVKKAPAAQPQMGTYKGGVWTADPPKKGEVGVPVPQNIDGGSAPAKSKPVKTQKKAEVDTDTDLAEMLNLAGLKTQVAEADLSECGMSSSPISGGYVNDMHSTDGRMNISTNMSTDGNKSVTITADGDAAAELMQMLKIAGLNSDGMSNVKDGVDLDHPGSVEIHGTMDSDGAEELAKKLRTAELDEAKDKRYHANTTPEEEVLPVQTQLKGGDGEVAGKEKKMKPHGYKFSDNPLAMKESMSLKLMKEYEGIKKTV